jgi:hypothetical protein
MMHTYYISEELTCFKEKSYEFIQIWMVLYGYDDCTHYSHIISCGQVLFYMVKYTSCLYHYSQQGWKTGNADVTSLFFRCTKDAGTGKGKRHTKILCVRNVRFFLGNKELAHIDPPLGLADTVTITIEYQKRDEHDESITQQLTRYPLLCPV